MQLVREGGINSRGESIVEILALVGLGVVARDDDAAGGVSELRDSGGGDAGVGVTSVGDLHVDCRLGVSEG